MVEALVGGLVAVVPQPIEGEIGGNAEEPGAKFSGGLVFVRAIDAKEDFLSQFFGDGDVAHQAVNVADHGTAMRIHNACEAGPVARLKCDHPRLVLFDYHARRPLLSEVAENARKVPFRKSSFLPPWRVAKWRQRAAPLARACDIVT